MLKSQRIPLALATFKLKDALDVVESRKDHV